MSERYVRVFSLAENLYAPGSPVIILAGALLLDKSQERVLAQLKFKNISEKPIKAVSVCVYPADTVGRSLGDPIEFSYLDLNEPRDSEWGDKKPIYLSDSLTRQIRLKLMEVVFSDNTIWTPDNTELLEPSRISHKFILPRTVQ